MRLRQCPNGGRSKELQRKKPPDIFWTHIVHGSPSNTAAEDHGQAKNFPMAVIRCDATMLPFLKEM